MGDLCVDPCVDLCETTPRKADTFMCSSFTPPPLECSAAAPSAGKEWEEHVQIRGLVEKIRKKQKGEFEQHNPPSELL